MFTDQLVNDFTEIIVEERALIDVRSPSEFAAGSITGAVNLPLLTDEQRHLVGIYYKDEGEEAANNKLLHVSDSWALDITEQLYEFGIRNSEFGIKN